MLNELLNKTKKAYTFEVTQGAKTKGEKKNKILLKKKAKRDGDTELLNKIKSERRKVKITVDEAKRKEVDDEIKGALNG